MAVLSLPLSFNNSFWSQDYRRGLEILFAKLEQGVAEDAEILAFIRARADAEGQLAASLITPAPTGPSGRGFSADDGASLLMTFRGLQEEAVAQGKAHKSIATELHTLVADPFDVWSAGHKERLARTKYAVLDQWVRSYEQSQGEVAKLKHQYLAKTRQADEADDDARFAPTSNGNGNSDNYTTSPRMRPVDGRSPPQRTASVSERIALRLKEIQKKSANKSSAVPEDDEEHSDKKIDKGKAKAVEDVSTSPALISPPPMSPPLPPSKIEIPGSPMPPMEPPPITIAGLSLPQSAISNLLNRAAATMPLRPVRFPLLGEYQDCFSGEDFVLWLKENVHALGDSFDRAEDAAKELTEKEGLLRRVGEFGNLFEHSDDAFYQFRPKAFQLGNRDGELPSSPSAKQPVTENIMKHTNTFLNVVTRAMNTQTGPVHVKKRQAAEEADKVYRVAVRRLDRHRLGLEERIEDTLKKLQRWEIERLRSAKSVLLQYQGTIANLPKALEHALERSSTLISAYNPDADLTALIERYRTGPFRPDPQVYESVTHDEPDVVFGVDLRKWAEGGWNTFGPEEEKEKVDVIPPVLSALLDNLKKAYEKLPNDDEKRKAWIYEVPLAASHHLREALNGIPPDQPYPPEVFAQYDAPVIASAIKLWMLELDPPLALYEGWDEFRHLYPTVGSAKNAAEDGDHRQELQNALLRLPKVHLQVLDAVVGHLKELISGTKVDEPNEVYLTKLALSVGRTIIRPKFESEISVQDRHPTLLFMDLVNNYDALLPPTIARKKRESARKVPIRKRTAPVDMRLSRSRLSVGKIDPQTLLAAQQLAQNPSLARAKSPVPPVPQLPTDVQVDKPMPPPPEAVQPPVAALTPPAPAPSVAAPKPAADSAPPRPTFREPPPEEDDLPPRPSFKEPPPETDDAPSTEAAHPSEDATSPVSEATDSDAPPPRPNFVDPPREDDSPAGSPSAASVAVTPPTPQNKQLKRSSLSNGSRPSSPLARYSSRSPSPPSATNENESLASGRPSINRTSSGQTHIRGPRISRGPRGPTGGNVGSIVNALNKGATSPTTPTSPSYKRMSSPGSRPSSIVGRASLQRRTMASDAEDDVVERK